MKHFLFLCGVCLALVAMPLNVFAQDYNALYKEFVAQANQGSFTAQTCDALYRCYTATMEALNKTATKNGATSVMRDIVPYLANGAAVSQQQGRQANAVLFAKAYVDAAQRPELAMSGFQTTDAFAQMSYFAAAALVNSRQYGEAIPYLKAYLTTGQEKYHKSVCANLIKACQMTKNTAEGLQACQTASAAYPYDYNMLSACVNFCIDSGNNDALQQYVSKALKIQPNDATLLNIQGKLYEEDHQFHKALEVYTTLQRTHPNALDVLKHLAVNTYNIGVLNYNKALSEKDKGLQKDEQREYKRYFNDAAGHLRRVIQQEPSSLKYTQALAVAYNCTGEQAQLEQVNNKLASMGGGRIASNYVPQLISYAQNAPLVAANGNNGAASVASTVASGAQVTPSYSSTSSSNGIPSYTSFAKEYIEGIVSQWQEKDPYETVSEYKKRVTEQTRAAKIQEAKQKAEEEYIRRYSASVDLNTLALQPYDAEHGVFLITSDKLGELVVPVPRENNEARVFESGWSGMQFSNPKYFIDGDHLALAQLTFTTPTGKSYQYDNKAALNYTSTDVDVNFGAIDYSNLTASTTDSSKSRVNHKTVEVGNSDVDMNIPDTKENNSTTFAVIIANENYQNVASVPMALNDGSTMAKYCEKTLGMPKDNVRYYSDASFGTMLRAVRDIKDIAAAYNGNINILFYYAGHGIPNESTKDAYLMPVDADGRQTEGCYALSRLYTELGSTGAKNIVVMLDACFSGTQRDGKMLASARGVALKAKPTSPNGNMVVLSAASGDETALPYTDKGHGLFTYYLLKKLQQTKGNVTLGELSDYVSQQVRRQAVVSNHKAQTPTATASSAIADTWRSIKLN